MLIEASVFAGNGNHKDSNFLPQSQFTVGFIVVTRSLNGSLIQIYDIHPLHWNKQDRVGFNFY